MTKLELQNSLRTGSVTVLTDTVPSANNSIYFFAAIDISGQVGSTLLAVVGQLLKLLSLATFPGDGFCCSCSGHMFASKRLQ